jgi:hypothetical protein
VDQWVPKAESTCDTTCAISCHHGSLSDRMAQGNGKGEVGIAA